MAGPFNYMMSSLNITPGIAEWYRIHDGVRS